MGVRMKIIKLMLCAIAVSALLSGCGSSGQAQMTSEKFKDMYAMLVKLDELKKKNIITEEELKRISAQPLSPQSQPKL